MKRILLVLMISIVVKTTVHAQAYNGNIEYQKTQQTAAIIELPYNQDVVEDGIKDYMAKLGYKGSSAKGFTVFRAARLDSSSDLSDLYFKLDRKGRKEKDVTVVTLLPAKPNQDILTRTGDSAIAPKIESAKSFLNNMAPYIDAHNTDVQVKAQQDVLKKAQKKLTGLQDDQASLEKKNRNLLSDQEQNKNDLLKQTQDMQNTVSNDADVKNKAQKRMNKLLDAQDDIRKKLRKVQLELDQNKTDQDKQQQETDKQQQILDVLKAKQKS